MVVTLRIIVIIVYLYTHLTDSLAGTVTTIMKDSIQNKYLYKSLSELCYFSDKK
jgi:hypothetical protein